jgi:hypothetical protein
MKTRILAILIVVAVAVASVGLGSWWFFDRATGPNALAPKIDGTTLYQAIAKVNQSLENVSGGPWAPFSIYGIAAEMPYSANVESYPSENQTVNACQAQFNGLTLWNGTIPVFDGTLDSGTAPFWQFGFYSNTSNQILVVTNVQGAVHVYPPMPVNGACSPWYDLGNPETWVRELSPFLPDSSAVAQSALTEISQRINQSWFDQVSPMVEIFTTGPGVFDLLGDLGGGAGVIFERCGLAGVSGLQPVLQWGENLQGANGSLSNGTTNCAFLNHPYFAGYGTYDLESAPTNETTFPGTSQIRAAFQVAMVPHNSSVPTNYDGWGLASWMTSLNATSSGRILPLGATSCGSWVSTPAECSANSTGWFAVLLSATGEWVNSYGALAKGGAGWSEPVTAVVSNQQLLIVVPSSWAVAGDQVNATSTVSTSSLVGTFIL